MKDKDLLIGYLSMLIGEDFRFRIDGNSELEVINYLNSREIKYSEIINELKTIINNPSFDKNHITDILKQIVEKYDKKY